MGTDEKGAVRMHPRYLVNRRTVFHLIRNLQPKESEAMRRTVEVFDRKNKSKITTLESKFPLLSIEQGCMVSKDADITVAFRVELPELFTVTSAEYKKIHSA